MKAGLCCGNGPQWSLKTKEDVMYYVGNTFISNLVGIIFRK